MKETTQRVWRSFAVLGLMLIFFSACKRDANIEPMTTQTALSHSGNRPDFKTSALAVTFVTSAPITLNNQSNLTISGISTPSITLNNCSNIMITNCRIGPNAGVGVTIYKCTNVRVSGTYIYNVSTGVYAIQSQGINVSGNYALNMQGPFPRGQFVQFNNVYGTGNRINSNKFQNILGQSYPEDAINIYQSNGTAADPIQVNLNQIRGGGPSSTGGGIMLGDGGGSNVVAKWNTLVDPGQYGMAVAGGTNMTIYQNNIYSKQQSFSNVGVYYWNQSGQASSGITIGSNAVNFTMYDGELNNTYLQWGAAMPTGWSTNYYNKSLGELTLPDTLVTIP
ncbi:MAG: right-handed parallel beta-helix repeat-containing protein [Bacteroidetes bacterium]|nr:right-handed parallel beta-helix repeat-containing protein [Bacteroidota bacterium]